MLIMTAVVSKDFMHSVIKNFVLALCVAEFKATLSGQIFETCLTLKRPGRQEPIREPVLNGTIPVQVRTTYHQAHRLFLFEQRSLPAIKKGGTYPSFPFYFSPISVYIDFKNELPHAGKKNKPTK